MSNKTLLIPDSRRRSKKIPKLRVRPLKGESTGDRWTSRKGPVTRKCIYLMTSWCLCLWLIISTASCYSNHAISFFYHKNDPTYNIHGDFMQIFILHFRNSGIGSNGTWKCILLPNWWYKYNHDNDVVRVFQLITLVGKFNVMDIDQHCFSAWSWCMVYRSLLAFFHKSLKL